ncbi:MAG: acyltransferase family protein [Pseudolysinimonas sp.]
MVPFLEVVRDAAWSSAFLANVHLAANPAGYFAQAQPSLFRHFWSLAVEEQFYLIWPPLLLIGVVLARKAWRPSVLAIILAVFLLSLILSVVLTDLLPTFAFYSLATRAWELAIGAALAVATTLVTRAPPRWAAEVAGAVGVVAILVSGIAFTEFVPIPGFAALVPTLGAALILWAGLHTQTAVGRVLGLWAPRRVGDISYPLYLWHWPVLLFGLPIVGAPPVMRLVLFAVALVLAIATYALIERPVSRLRVTSGFPRVLLSGVAATAAIVIGASVVLSSSPTTGGPAVTAPAIGHPTASIVDGRIVLSPERSPDSSSFVPENAVPQLSGIDGDLAEVFTNDCFGLELKVCEGGDPDGSVRVVLTGDSQAGHWWPAVDAAAQANGWKAYIVGMNGCPLAEGVDNPQPQAAEELVVACESWQRNAPDAIAALEPDVVLYASHVATFYGGSTLAPKAEALWRSGVPEGVSVVSAELADEHADAFFSPADVLCSDECGLLDGNHVMSRDADHMSAS